MTLYLSSLLKAWADAGTSSMCQKHWKMNLLCTGGWRGEIMLGLQSPRCANGCHGCPAPIPAPTPGMVAGLMALRSAWAPRAWAACTLLEQTELLLAVNKCFFFFKHPYFDHSWTTVRSSLFSSFVLCMQTFQELDFPCLGDSFLKRKPFPLAVLFPAPM